MFGGLVVLRILMRQEGRICILAGLLMRLSGKHFEESFALKVDFYIQSQFKEFSCHSLHSLELKVKLNSSETFVTWCCESQFFCEILPMSGSDRERADVLGWPNLRDMEIHILFDRSTIQTSTRHCAPRLFMLKRGLYLTHVFSFQILIGHCSMGIWSDTGSRRVGLDGSWWRLY